MTTPFNNTGYNYTIAPVNSAPVSTATPVSPELYGPGNPAPAVPNINPVGQGTLPQSQTGYAQPSSQPGSTFDNFDPAAFIQQMLSPQWQAEAQQMPPELRKRY